MSLHLCDNLINVILINWDIFLSTEYIIGSQIFSEMLNHHQYNDLIDLVKSSFVLQVLYNTVL